MRDGTPAPAPLNRILAAANRLGDLLHRRADRRAEAYGWAVERSRSGLTRVYRDRRWQRARPCPRCRGAGELDVADCGWCAGTGRVLGRTAEHSR